MDTIGLLAEQLDWHWTNQLRPRLAGLTDQEYFWSPHPGPGPCARATRRPAARNPARAR